MALICTPPANCGRKSHHAVLPNAGAPGAQVVGSGSPPANGTPSRLGLNVSAWVVASVVSTPSRYSRGTVPFPDPIVVEER